MDEEPLSYNYRPVCFLMGFGISLADLSQRFLQTSSCSLHVFYQYLNKIDTKPWHVCWDGVSWILVASWWEHIILASTGIKHIAHLQRTYFFQCMSHSALQLLVGVWWDKCCSYVSMMMPANILLLSFCNKHSASLTQNFNLYIEMELINFACQLIRKVYSPLPLI